MRHYLFPCFENLLEKLNWKMFSSLIFVFLKWKHDPVLPVCRGQKKWYGGSELILTISTVLQMIGLTIQRQADMSCWKGWWTEREGYEGGYLKNQAGRKGELKVKLGIWRNSLVPPLLPKSHSLCSTIFFHSQPLRYSCVCLVDVTCNKLY